MKIKLCQKSNFTLYYFLIDDNYKISFMMPFSKYDFKFCLSKFTEISKKFNDIINFLVQITLQLDECIPLKNYYFVDL